MKHNFLPPAAAAILAALPVLAAADILPALQDPIAEYERFSAAPAASPCAGAGQLALAVAPAETGAEAVADARTGSLKILYRTAFNQVTEGWNWHPEADAAGEDYYRFKYFPLGAFSEERDSYRFEDKIGEPQEFRVVRRYAYFFAFDNLYDFFPRAADDDAGFRAEIPLPPQEAERLASGDLRMALLARLADACIAESTTFWKATHGKPVDFTLKKRYLLGHLDEVWFYDAATRRILARFGSRPKQAKAGGL